MSKRQLHRSVAKIILFKLNVCYVMPNNAFTSPVTASERNPGAHPAPYRIQPEQCCYIYGDQKLGFLKYFFQGWIFSFSERHWSCLLRWAGCFPPGADVLLALLVRPSSLPWHQRPGFSHKTCPESSKLSGGDAHIPLMGFLNKFGKRSKCSMILL